MRRTKMLHVWIHTELKDKLDAKAKEIHVSTSYAIRKGIEMWLTNPIVDTHTEVVKQFLDAALGTETLSVAAKEFIQAASNFEMQLANMISEGASDDAKWQYVQDSIRQGTVEREKAYELYDRLNKTGDYSNDV